MTDDQQPLNTEYLLNMMAKLQFMLGAAKEKRMTSSEPRYDAIVIKCKDLLERLQRLIPAVMLNEIALFDRATKELYQTLGEKEDFAIKGEKDSGH